MRLTLRSWIALPVVGIVLLLQSVPNAFADPPQVPEEDLTKEILQERERFIRDYGQINRLNPLSPDYGKEKAGGFAENSPLSHAEKYLSNPVVQGLFHFFKSPPLKAAIEEITKSPYRKHLLYTQIGWLVFFIVLRAWRMSKVPDRKWVRRIWVTLWTFVLYVAVASIAIPTLFLGNAYYRIVLDIFRWIQNFS